MREQAEWPYQAIFFTEPALRFTAYGQAKPGGSKKAFVNPKTGRAIVVDASDNKSWRQQVAAQGLAALGVTEDTLAEFELPRFPVEPLLVQFEFIRPRPGGHRGKHGLLPSAPAYPVTRPDVLKLARAAEDALTGIVWRDDAQIVHEVLLKTYGEPERLEVLVRPML